MKRETIKEAVEVVLSLVESQVNPDKPGIAGDWLHHVRGCSHFGAYPNCTAINQYYFGEDSEEWHKTPTGRDSDKFEAACLELAARKVINLLAVFA